MNNSGTISAISSATAHAGSDHGYAYIDYTAGVYADDPMSLNNSGTILASSTAYASSTSGSAEAYSYDTHGLLSDYGVTAVNNTGNVAAFSSATAISGAHNANARSEDTHGIYISDLGSVTNSGTIGAQSTATANSAGDAAAFSRLTAGVYLEAGDVKNSGTISAASSASATGANFAAADSVEITAIYGWEVTNLENSGLITTTAAADATAAAEDGYATSNAIAAGIYLSPYSPLTVTNSGTISVDSRAATSAHYSDAEAVALAVPARCRRNFHQLGNYCRNGVLNG